MEDVKEVEEILSNLRWLQKEMPKALQNWKTVKPQCSFHTGIIREICNSPGRINSLVFDPLIRWLSDYILNRESRIAFAGPGGLDAYLKKGLRIIAQYIILIDFFSKNTDFFAPTPKVTSSNLSAASEAVKKQVQYREIINTLSSKVIGCNNQLSFIFLDLSKTISDLPEDLRRVQNYLENYCLTLRTRRL